VLAGVLFNYGLADSHALRLTPSHGSMGLPLASYLRRSTLAIFTLTVLLAFAGAAYQTLATWAAARRNPELGQLFDIGGRRLKLHCVGEGTPTTILESGLGDFLNEWKSVQPAIAAFTRVCSYDRAGYGESDPGPSPRTSAQIADELRALLQKAGETPPYLLVGHSFGGYAVRVFNGKYPADVTGIVLVDATQEDQYELLPKAWLALGDSMLHRYRSQARWSPILINLGITRLRLTLQGVDAGHLLLRPNYLKARASELEAIRTSAEQARAAGTIGAKPLVVITAGKNSDTGLRNSLTQQELDAFENTWVYDLQLRLTALSTRGKRILVADSGHDIPSERPDVVVSAVREIYELAVH